MLLYAITIFLAAFLVFQIQPIIAKMILPWFGGGSAVWTTCMLFFQAALLLGYLYAHWVHEYLGARKQAVLHAAVLVASFLALPVAPDPSWANGGQGDPSWRILGLLAVTIGLPYLLLSTTSPLLQAWYARTHTGATPYRLYALSNLASLLALVSYPVLVEPHLSLRTQAWVWSAAYAAFVLLGGWAACRSLGVSGQASGGCAGEETAPPPAPGWGLRLLWMALASCTSTLLLAVTAHLTRDVAAVPFLWILPLSVYLLSFIICFDTPRLYYRPVYLPLLAVALGLMAHLVWPGTEKSDAMPVILLCAGALFVISMVCHGELVRSKPHPRHLTVFYLMLCLGGAGGGVFVGLVAPNFFALDHEFPIGLGWCAALVVLVLLREYRELFRCGWWRLAPSALAAGLGAYLVVLGAGMWKSIEGYRVVARNFYGQLRVYDRDEDDGAGVRRKLLHGVINHGEQVLDKAYRRKPGTYYCPEAGIGRVMTAGRQGPPRRIGVLGLGTGTLTVYGRRGDVFRIYEINPLVIQLARTEFTYLRDTAARVEIALGDGRLALEREPGQQLDVLVMDAFSGDSVPVHLLTREAVRTYLRHLKPGGILALNISNRYIDLRPVMARMAREFGKLALCFDFDAEEEDLLCFGSTWVLIVDAATRQALAGALDGGKVLESRPGFRLWTDDFSNLWGILE